MIDAIHTLSIKHSTPFVTWLMVRTTAVSDCVRTSLGPRGMDKMIITKDGETVITNDGATMLKHLSVMHPAARMVSGMCSWLACLLGR